MPSFKPSFRFKFDSVTPNWNRYNNSVIVCDGNSLTAGQGGTPYPTQLQALLATKASGFTVTNKGVGAQQTTQMQADASTDIDPLYNPAKFCVLIAWEVGNDIYFNGNVVSAIANFDTYCNARLAVGWKVVRVGLADRIHTTPFGDTPTQYKAKLSQANALLSLKSNFVDLISDSRLADATNTTYFGDLIHCTTAGYGVVASKIFSKLASVF